MSSRPSMMTREGDVRGVLDGLSQTDFPKAQNVRRMLACLADLRQYGLADLTVLEVAWALKVDRIKRIGYQEYLHEILGRWAKHPTGRCRLWRQGKEMEIPDGYWADQPLATYLTYLESRQGLQNMPDRATFQTEGGTLTRYI